MRELLGPLRRFAGVPPKAVALGLLALLPMALAHGDLVSSAPADRSVLEGSPEEAVLTFSEPVEVPFSTFKVYRLDVPLPEAAPDEREWQRLGGLAGALVSEVLTSEEESEARVDSGVQTSDRRSEEVALGLQEPLQPGVYVLMWRVLSIDTHIVQGFVTFIVAPEG